MLILATKIRRRYKRYYKTVIVSTASPYKFSKDVISSIQSIDCNLDDFEIINKLSDLSKTKIPGPIEKLKELEIRHNITCEKMNLNLKY